MAENGRLLGAAILCALHLSACHTHYKPQRSARISVVMQGGAIAYEKDGETISMGFMGTGLVEAVEDDPEAKEAAETFQSRSLTGLILMVVGAGCLLGGFYMAIDDIDRSSDDRTSGRTASQAGLFTCGVGGLIGGSIVAVSAQPYQYDAVNIYNDNIERRRVWYPPPYPVPMPPPAAQPRPPAPAPPPTAPPAAAPAPAPAAPPARPVN